MILYFKKKFLLLIFIIFGAGMHFPSLALDSIDEHKKVISPEEQFWVESQLQFSARIDSGAKSTSIHAVDIEVKDEAESIEENVGKQVDFTIVNEEGEQWQMSRRISSVTKVRNSQGVEFRYNVPMRIGWNNIKQERLEIADGDMYPWQPFTSFVRRSHARGVILVFSDLGQ